MADTPQWTRLRNEPPKAYAAFQRFLSLPTERRTLLEVARQLREQSGSHLTFEAKQPHQLKSVPGQIGKWSSQFKWHERAAAWDHHVDARIRAKQLSVIEKMAERHAQQALVTGQALMAPVLAFVRALQDPNRAITLETAQIGELLTMSLAASKFLPKIQEAERLSRGVRIEKQKDDVQGGYEWTIKIHQPERAEAEPEALELEAAQPDEWEETK